MLLLSKQTNEKKTNQQQQKIIRYKNKNRKAKTAMAHTSWTIDIVYVIYVYCIHEEGGGELARSGDRAKHDGMEQLHVFIGKVETHHSTHN